MTSVPYINTHAIRELALSLRLQGRGSAQECQRLAAKIVARREREQAKATGAPPAGKLTVHNAADWVISKIMRMVANANATAELMRKKPAPPPVEPRIDCNPVVVVESQSNVTQYPPSAALVSAPFSHAQLLDENLFAAKYHSQTTMAWKQSILQNQEIAAEKQRRSSAYQAAMRSGSRYVG
jgi:hypothetical protein